jgi:hypothetical protein
MKRAGFPIEYGPADELGRSAFLCARPVWQAHQHPYACIMQRIHGLPSLAAG